MATFNDDFTFHYEVGERPNGEKVNLTILVRHNIVVRTYEDNESTIERLEILKEGDLSNLTEIVKYAAPDIYEEIETKAQDEVDKRFSLYERNGDLEDLESEEVA